MTSDPQIPAARYCFSSLHHWDFVKVLRGFYGDGDCFSIDAVPKRLECNRKRKFPFFIVREPSSKVLSVADVLPDFLNLTGF